MFDVALLVSILDGLAEPVLVADTEPVIRYMKRPAISFYKEGASLIGRPLLDCHNPVSQQMIRGILAEVQNGLDERLIAHNNQQRVYMRAVRTQEGRLLGYLAL